MQEQEVDPRRCCWQRQEAMETSGFVMASGSVNADCRRRDRALEARGLLVLGGRFMPPAGGQWVPSGAAAHLVHFPFSPEPLQSFVWGGGLFIE